MCCQFFDKNPHFTKNYFCMKTVFTFKLKSFHYPLFVNWRNIKMCNRMSQTPY